MNDTTAKGDSAHGMIERHGDGWRVAFTRLLPTDRATAWRLVTEPEHLARWFERPVLTPADAPGPGTRYAFAGGGNDDEDVPYSSGEVVRCDPQQSFAVTWVAPDDEDSPDTLVTVTLEDVDGGIRLSLEHSGLGSADAPNYGAGWHAYLDGLTGGGVLLPTDLTPWQERYDARREDYTARVGG